MRWRRGIAVVALATVAYIVASAWADEDPSTEDRGQPSDPAPAKVSPSEDRTPPRHKLPAGPHAGSIQVRLGDLYSVRYTDHFAVFYNTDAAAVGDFVTRLETTYNAVERFANRSEISIRQPKEKLPVVFSADRNEFTRVVQQIAGRPAASSVAGLYFPDVRCSFFYDSGTDAALKQNIDRAKALREQARSIGDARRKRQLLAEARRVETWVERQGDTANRSIVQHETAHQLLYAFGVHQLGSPNPPWFVEGLATLFESPPTSDGGGINNISQSRLGEIRAIEKAGRLLPLKELIGKQDFRSTDQAEMLRNYSEAWALAHYLTKTRHEGVNRFIARLKSRQLDHAPTPEEQVADFEVCFGKIDAAFTKRWIDYWKRLPYKPPR